MHVTSIHSGVEGTFELFQVLTREGFMKQLLFIKFRNSLGAELLTVKFKHLLSAHAYYFCLFRYAMDHQFPL